MPGEDTPAQHKSSESVTDADVQRLQNIALAGASQTSTVIGRGGCQAIDRDKGRLLYPTHLPDR